MFYTGKTRQRQPEQAINSYDPGSKAARMRSTRHFKEWSWRGLGPRVIALVTLAVLVTGASIGTSVIQTSRSTLRTDIFTRNLATADLAGNLAKSFVEGAEAGLRQLAARPLFIAAILDQDLAQAEWHMDQVMKTDPRFDNIAIYTADGIGWASGLGSAWQNRGGSVADREWFKQTLATRASYLGIPLLSRGTGHPVVSYTVPVLDDKGELRAVLGGGISLAALSTTLTGIRLSESARVSLLDLRQGGLVLADANQDLILQPVSGPDEATSQALAGRRGAFEVSSSTGARDLTAFAPVSQLPWTVLIREPASSAFAPMRALTERALLMIAGVLLLALILSVLLARRMTTPLRRLAKGAEEVGGGNLDFKLGVTSGDEIGKLSRAFDLMTAELKATLVSRDDLAAEVVERSRAEDDLREANDYLDNLIECANAPIIVWSPEFRITRFNRAFAALTGRDAEAVIGESLELLFPEAHVASSMALIKRTLTGERWETVDLPILNLDGSVRSVLWNSATLFAADGVTMIGHHREETGRRTDEEGAR
jgi:PAS domain S-box-containing protein